MEKFCIQSCSKPLNYSVAISDLGADKVHESVGHEPSGQSFNAIILDRDSKWTVILLKCIASCGVIIFFFILSCLTVSYHAMLSCVVSYCTLPNSGLSHIMGCLT